MIVIARRSTARRGYFTEQSTHANKESAVILSPEVGVRISGSSVELVVDDGAKTNPRQALMRSLRGFRLRSTPQDDYAGLFANVTCFKRLPRCLRLLAMTIKKVTPRKKKE